MAHNGLPGVVCQTGNILNEVKINTSTLMHTLQEAGVTLNVEKCELSKQEVSLLGRILSADCETQDPKRAI